MRNNSALLNTNLTGLALAAQREKYRLPLIDKSEKSGQMLIFRSSLALIAAGYFFFWGGDKKQKITKSDFADSEVALSAGKKSNECVIKTAEEFTIIYKKNHWNCEPALKQ